MSRKITIPAEYEAVVLKMLEEMQIQDGKATVPERQEPGFVEVRKVLDCKNNGHNFQFLLKFSDHTQEWVDDKDTNCEWLISEFLAKRGIPTMYLIARVSTKIQAGDDKLSLDAQESEMLAWAEQKLQGQHVRIKIVRISASAYKGIPKDMQKITEAANDGDSIICYRVDRLSRNIVRFLEVLENLDERGVEIFSLTDGLNYTEHKLEMIELILQAQKESVMIGKRVKMGVEKRKQRGDETLGAAPYGQCLVREQGGRIVLAPAAHEQEVIEMIRQGATATELNEQGKLKRGKRWSAAMVRGVRNSLRAPKRARR